MYRARDFIYRLMLQKCTPCFVRQFWLENFLKKWNGNFVKGIFYNKLFPFKSISESHTKSEVSFLYLKGNILSVMDVCKYWRFCFYFILSLWCWLDCRDSRNKRRIFLFSGGSLRVILINWWISSGNWWNDECCAPIWLINCSNLFRAWSMCL